MIGEASKSGAKPATSASPLGAQRGSRRSGRKILVFQFGAARPTHYVRTNDKHHGSQAGAGGRSRPVIRIENVHKIYDLGEMKVHALRGVSFEVRKAEFVAVMGPSGSGKSTVMNMLGCLDRPTKGQYFLDGIDVSKMSKSQLARIRETVNWDSCSNNSIWLGPVHRRSKTSNCPQFMRGSVLKSGASGHWSP